MRDNRGAGGTDGIEIAEQPPVSRQQEYPLQASKLTIHSYGISKVYDQQWEYLLTDAQAAQNSMRALLKVVRTGGLDPQAGKAR